MISVVINLLVFSGFLFREKLNLDPNYVYQKYVETQANAEEDDFKDEHDHSPTFNELAWLSIIFRIVIICVAPASLYIYRSRLLLLEAFQTIKKERDQPIGSQV